MNGFGAAGAIGGCELHWPVMSPTGASGICVPPSQCAGRPRPPSVAGARCPQLRGWLRAWVSPRAAEPGGAHGRGALLALGGCRKVCVCALTSDLLSAPAEGEEGTWLSGVFSGKVLKAAPCLWQPV